MSWDQPSRQPGPAVSRSVCFDLYPLDGGGGAERQPVAWPGIFQHARKDWPHAHSFYPDARYRHRSVGCWGRRVPLRMPLAMLTCLPHLEPSSLSCLYWGGLDVGVFLSTVLGKASRTGRLPTSLGLLSPSCPAEGLPLSLDPSNKPLSLLTNLVALFWTRSNLNTSLVPVKFTSQLSNTVQGIQSFMR